MSKDGPHTDVNPNVELKYLVSKVENLVSELVTDTNMHIPNHYWKQYNDRLKELDLYIDTLVKRVNK
jgi:hypothetical protein